MDTYTHAYLLRRSFKKNKGKKFFSFVLLLVLIGVGVLQAILIFNGRIW
jgi:hypothetical protein